MVSLLGGPSDLAENSDRYLRKAAVVVPVLAAADGWLSGCATRDLGLVVVQLGGGRKRPTDDIDHAVGIDRILPLGTKVLRGEPIALVHAADHAQGEAMAKNVSRCFTIGDEPPAPQPVVLKRIG
jgi:thymidine phosphorylase